MHPKKRATPSTFSAVVKRVSMSGTFCTAPLYRSQSARCYPIFAFYCTYILIYIHGFIPRYLGLLRYIDIVLKHWIIMENQEQTWHLPHALAAFKTPQGGDVWRAQLLLSRGVVRASALRWSWISQGKGGKWKEISRGISVIFLTFVLLCSGCFFVGYLDDGCYLGMMFDVLFSPIWIDLEHLVIFFHLEKSRVE